MRYLIYVLGLGLCACSVASGGIGVSPDIPSEVGPVFVPGGPTASAMPSVPLGVEAGAPEAPESPPEPAEGGIEPIPDAGSPDDSGSWVVEPLGDASEPPQEDSGHAVPEAGPDAAPEAGPDTADWECNTDGDCADDGVGCTDVWCSGAHTCVWSWTQCGQDLDGDACTAESCDPDQDRCVSTSMGNALIGIIGREVTAQNTQSFDLITTQFQFCVTDDNGTYRCLPIEDGSWEPGQVLAFTLAGFGAEVDAVAITPLGDDAVICDAL